MIRLHLLGALDLAASDSRARADAEPPYRARRGSAAADLARTAHSP